MVWAVSNGGRIGRLFYLQVDIESPFLPRTTARLLINTVYSVHQAHEVYALAHDGPSQLLNTHAPKLGFG